MSPPTESFAFPTYLASEVAVIVPVLAEKQQHPPSDTFSAIVEGEKLEIPNRVYYQENNVLEAIEYPGAPGQIALCLGTRHHNGFLRQKCLKRVILLNQPWVAPFVIHLVGEYVVEIIQDIENAIPSLNSTVYAQFLAENRKLFSVIDSRTISYWNEYYRFPFKSKSDYPGFRVVSAFRELQCALTTQSRGPP